MRLPAPVGAGLRGAMVWGATVLTPRGARIGRNLRTLLFRAPCDVPVRHIRFKFEQEFAIFRIVFCLFDRWAREFPDGFERFPQRESAEVGRVALVSTKDVDSEITWSASVVGNRPFV